MLSARPKATQLFVPVDEECSSFEGFITVQAGGRDHYFWLRISGVPPGGTCGASETLTDAQLQCGRELAELLEGHEGLVASRLRGGRDVESCLTELRDVVETLLLHRTRHAAPDVAFYSLLVAELDAVGWDAVSWMSPDCTALVLQYKDMAGRLHQMRVDLPSGYPAVPPAVITDLPKPLRLQWGNQAGAVGAVGPGGATDGSTTTGLVKVAMEQWQQAVSSYQDLWDCLEDFDRHAWVLEPAPSSVPAADIGQGDGVAQCRPFAGACCYRRVGFARSCSFSIRLDPQAPRRVPPDVQFLGPPATVSPLQQRFYNGLAGWDGDRLPRENLEALLGMTLPSRCVPSGDGDAQQVNEDDMNMDCPICYSYHLALEDDEEGGAGGGAQDLQGQRQPCVPSTSCPNPCCSRVFHRRCLAEWLQALQTTTAVFDSLFGECPFCKSPISVKTTDDSMSTL